MAPQASVVPIGRVPWVPAELPGSVRLRREVAPPAAYAVFDCETTGTDPAVDEIVSLAVVLLDANGTETTRYTRLVRPSCAIPAEATAIHGIGDEDVAAAPPFEEIAAEVLSLLACDTVSQASTGMGLGLLACDTVSQASTGMGLGLLACDTVSQASVGVVFVAHNAGFDLLMLQNAFARAGIDYRPAAVACTLEAFRLLEPRAPNHRLESICERRGIVLEGAHQALGDVLATAALLRVLLHEGIAPETVKLDHVAYMRLRSRGDTRPASEPQVRRMFGLARSAGLVLPDGAVDRDRVVALVERTTGGCDVDALTREQVQDVYDALDRLAEAATARAVPA